MADANRTDPPQPHPLAAEWLARRFDAAADEDEATERAGTLIIQSRECGFLRGLPSVANLAGVPEDYLSLCEGVYADLQKLGLIPAVDPADICSIDGKIFSIGGQVVRIQSFSAGARALAAYIRHEADNSRLAVKGATARGGSGGDEWPNDPRDAWMLSMRNAGKTQGEILAMLKKDHAEWELVDTEQAVGLAIKRYCKGNNPSCSHP